MEKTNKMMENLVNMNIVIVGGSGDIGAGIAKKLIDLGVKRIGIMDMVEVPKTLPKDKIHFIQNDIRDRKKTLEAFKSMQAELKSIDMMINAAGIINEEQQELTVDTNMNGYMNVFMAAQEMMRKDHENMQHRQGRGGTIISICSTAALNPCFCAPIYTACMQGMMGFHRSIANKLFEAKTGLRMLLICPGYTETKINKTKQHILCDGIHLPSRDNQKSQTAQPIEAVVDAILRMYSEGENGSIWRVDGAKMEQIEMQREVNL